MNWSEHVYESRAADLILYGRALGLSHAEAEDVLHDTFVALLQRETPAENAEYYCLRAFRNRALNYRRSLWRRIARELESRCWFEKSPDRTSAERDAMRLLAELPIGQREVIVLKIWHGCTFEKIGELLQISPNTASGRYRYGIQKLRLRLKGTLYERDDIDRDAIAFMASAPTLPGD